MIAAELTGILEQYSGAVQDKKRFVGLMKDLFPGQLRETNLLIALSDMGFPAEIATAEQITGALAYRFVKRLMDEYGVNQVYADWAVAMWCVCYGQNLLHKPCAIALSESGDRGKPGVRQGVSGETRQQELPHRPENSNNHIPRTKVQRIRNVLADLFLMEEKYETKEIVSRIHAATGIKESTILPSDMCYNHNIFKAADFDKQLRIFVKLNYRTYRYVGENYPYTGAIQHRFKNGDLVTVGNWQDGVFTRYLDV
jgi:hypothetical protein